VAMPTAPLIAATALLYGRHLQQIGTSVGSGAQTP